jgi:RHH-type transcriptional regulator, proline utilization regulon repressor / proline dehydrogenase / delta 1-pyrroline-5-carboxylate dehydrogenase
VALAHALADPEFLTLGLAEHLLALQSKAALPGPTGEENSLRLVPRGVLLCCGGQSPETLIRQVLIALATGNATLILFTPDTAAIETMLAQIAVKSPKISLPYAFIKNPDLTTCLGAAIDGVIVDGPLRPAIAKSLAVRKGAITPCLSVDDDPERYFHERTLTIDTTAAGGNASLLAMQAGEVG